MNDNPIMDLLGTTGDYAVACARRHGPDLLGAADWTRVARLIDQRLTADALTSAERRQWLLALAVVAASGHLRPGIRMVAGDRDVAQQMARQLCSIVAKIQGNAADRSKQYLRRHLEPFPIDRLPEDEELWGMIQEKDLQVVFWWPRWRACTVSANPLPDVLACLWVRELEYGSLGRIARAQDDGHIAGGRHVARPLTPEQWAWIKGPSVQNIITELERDLGRR